MSERLSTGRKCLSTHNLFLKGVVVILQMILGGELFQMLVKCLKKCCASFFKYCLTSLLFNRMFYVRVYYTYV